MTCELTQEVLKERLRYDQGLGVFFRKGKAAGWINDQGYRMISINRKEYRAHRLVFLYVLGRWPERQVDHINHNRLDNRFSNLREADDSINRKNMGLYSTNKSGYCGVYFDKIRKKWQSYITVNYRKKHLGYFLELDDAIDIRKQAEIVYGFHENHGRMTKTEFVPDKEGERDGF